VEYNSLPVFNKLKGNTMKGTTTVSARVFGFCTVLLILTLDASNGKDILDVIVPYIESVTISK